MLAYQDLTIYDRNGKSATFHSYDTDKGSVSDTEIAKHSPNLIDLIEVNDYVNGKEVMEFDFEDGTILGYPIYTSDGLFNTIECYVPLEQVKIKTILTYECFKREIYEV